MAHKAVQHTIIREIESLLRHCYNRGNLITGLTDDEELKLRQLNVKLLNLSQEYERLASEIYSKNN